MEDNLRNALDLPVFVGGDYAYSYHNGGLRITAICKIESIEDTKVKLNVSKRLYFLNGVRIEQKWDDHEASQLSVSSNVLFPIPRDFAVN